MGWDFCQAWQSKEDILTELGHTFPIIAHAFTREQGETCLWMAVAVDGHAPMIVMALIEQDTRLECYGFKEMSEDMGPCFYRVPRAVWEKVKDFPAPSKGAAEWRAKVKVAA